MEKSDQVEVDETEIDQLCISERVSIFNRSYLKLIKVLNI